MKTLFVAPYIPSAAAAIKLAALYFDEVVINERALVEAIPEGVRTNRPIVGGQQYILQFRVNSIVSTLDDGLRNAIRPLLDEGVVRIEAEPTTRLMIGEGKVRLRKEFHRAKNVVFKGVQFDNDSFNELHTRLVGPLGNGERADQGFVSTYLEGLFVECLDAALRGETVVTSSSTLHRLIENAATSPMLEALPNLSQPRFAMDVLEATLMDSSALDCSEVLEARYQLRDELAEFRKELRRLQFEFNNEFGFDKVFREGRAIADARLARRIREIEAKVSSGKVSVFRKLLEAVEKPGAYVPLVGSLFSGLPLELALLLSLGIISARVALEAWEEHKQYASDGLFYLVKLKSFIAPKYQSVESHLLPSSSVSEQKKTERFFVWPEDTLVAKDEFDEEAVLDKFRSMQQE